MHRNVPFKIILSCNQLPRCATRDVLGIGAPVGPLFFWRDVMPDQWNQEWSNAVFLPRGAGSALAQGKGVDGARQD